MDRIHLTGFRLHFLPDAIESALAQTHSRIEVLVVDYLAEKRFLLGRLPQFA
jgi:hypothetical protein